ncbi:MAG: 4-hydroxy-tetrahydrodipicolinate synthase [Acidimicrobiia bacterium]|jgi:4-hydroxy-tetrahydrodipicolinate synthase|nr:4-hydroxy-tetrahydrodipicolinate synthase [Acidimicrobiia bacterium]
MARFGAVLTAMITPFDKAGELDYDVAATLARWLVDQGNQGLVVAGTTGESPTITHAEQVRLFQVIRESVSVPVVVGVGSNSTRESLELAEAAVAAQADGVLIVTPYYNRPSQAGLLAHFKAVAAVSDLPAMLYDIPVRTGRKIEFDTLLELAETVPNIVALKDAAGNPAETAKLIAKAPGDFEVYSGDDSLTLPLLSVGAVGVVGVCTHWCAAEMAEMVAAYHKGDVERARQLNALMADSYDFETGLAAPNPVPSKAMLRTLGLAVGECRPPMGPTPAGLEDRARAVHAHLEQARNA